jgi:hypothetical protein
VLARGAEVKVIAQRSSQSAEKKNIYYGKGETYTDTKNRVFVRETDGRYLIMALLVASVNG